MLKLIPASSLSLFPKDVDAMFRSRALTFSERLGWDVVVTDGYERDAFDDLNPLYLVSVDPATEQYWGSLRLLPTTGPNMLRDVFPFLLDEGQVIESATIWESSRICAVSAEGQPERAKGSLNFVLSELIAGIGEVAILAGLTQIVSVFDARIFRVLKAAGCNPRIIGRPQRNRGHYELRWSLRYGRSRSAGFSRCSRKRKLGSRAKCKRTRFRIKGLRDRL